MEINRRELLKAALILPLAAKLEAFMPYYPVRSMGMYTHFLQDINWAETGDIVSQCGYNMYYVHGLSPWAAEKDRFYWVFENGRFNLLKPNPWYRQHVRDMFRELPGKRKIRIGVALFDFYYQDNYINKGALEVHPFRNNNLRIDWSNDTDSLGASLPWFTHVAWKTSGTQLKERVSEYTIKYKWLWSYIRMWGQEIKRHRKEFPGAPMTFVRYINEAFTRYRTTGELQKKEGGEDKIYQIIVKEWEKLGLVHGKDFNIVDDHMIFLGNDFVGETVHDPVRITGWAPGGAFDRQPDLRYLREVHVTNPDEYKYVRELMLKYPRTAGNTFTIVSNDSWKPEDSSYIPELSKLFHSDLRLLDVKVPSEKKVIGRPIDSSFFREKLHRVAPVMERIAR